MLNRRSLLTTLAGLLGLAAMPAVTEASPEDFAGVDVGRYSWTVTVICEETEVGNFKILQETVTPPRRRLRC